MDYLLLRILVLVFIKTNIAIHLMLTTIGLFLIFLDLALLNLSKQEFLLWLFFNNTMLQLVLEPHDLLLTLLLVVVVKVLAVALGLALATLASAISETDVSER